MTREELNAIMRERDAKARELWFKDVPQKDIAKLIGCHRHTVRTIAKRNGWPKQPREAIRAQISERQKAAWADPVQRAKMTAAIRVVWQDRERVERQSAIVKIIAAKRLGLDKLTPQQRADYDLYRSKDFSMAEALSALGLAA
jgi:DNA invertase Pin-like site-specific DNA recombinase